MNPFETHERKDWTTEEKLRFFGDGEWLDETDFFSFHHLGYEACVLRVIKREIYAKELAYFGGHLCGYVRIPPDHPYFMHKEIDLNCHGGITFNEVLLNQVLQEHWIGFDCGHSGDRIPSMEHLGNTIPEMIELRKRLPAPKGMEDHPWFKPIYRNMQYCILECKCMITQLIDISMNSYIKNAEIKDNMINEFNKVLGTGPLCLGIFCTKCNTHFELGREGIGHATMMNIPFIEYVRWVQSSDCKACGATNSDQENDE